MVVDAEVPVLLVGPHCEPDPTFTDPIVVCHDGSTAADAILPIASEWARRLQVGIVVVHVFHPLDVESASAPTAAVEPALEMLRADVAAVDVHAVSNSYPVGAILDCAQTVPASMVALSTHGRTGLARMALGSVAASVIHACPRPVLVNRPRVLA